MEQQHSVFVKLIVAACDGLGIGSKGTLPWPRLDREMKYFRRMTTTCNDSTKMNAVIMGRRTWESIPQQNKPLPNRLNIVLSRNPDFAIDHEEVMVMSSLKEALTLLNERVSTIESCWIIGGAELYAEALLESSCRLYVTHIRRHFDCDTFIALDMNRLQEVEDPNVDYALQSECGIDYVYRVYEKKQ